MVPHPDAPIVPNTDLEPSEWLADSKIWTLYTDGSSNQVDCVARIVLIDLEGIECNHYFSLDKTNSVRRKYQLQRDTDMRFLLLGQTVVPEVYVDLVEKVARDVRDQPAVPPRRSPIPIGVPVAPSPPPFATESVPTT
ncbi:hypothetical protein LWI29_014562 [Acer saccharum]|uniref:Uncharacterized protein n=1 Tax=Acer saccharum TaxID=4024 RepID=A0AA39RKT6_ACESA|nr:hypothetical protein LWI29_014562 [Acer saccharum]